jgi:hypothetical protein
MQRRPNSTVLLERARVACLQGALPGFFGEELRLPNDITERKHGGHRNSKKANAGIEKTSVRERVRIFIAGCAERGTTLHEIAEHIGRPIHSISGRVSELKALNKVFDSGRDRQGCSVLVADRRWVNEGFAG